MHCGTPAPETHWRPGYPGYRRFRRMPRQCPRYGWAWRSCSKPLDRASTGGKITELRRKPMTPLNRRSFFRNLALAAAGIFILPALRLRAHAADTPTAPPAHDVDEKEPIALSLG